MIQTIGFNFLRIFSALTVLPIVLMVVYIISRARACARAASCRPLRALFT